MRRSRAVAFTALVATSALVLAACSDSSTTQQGATTPASAPASESGAASESAPASESGAASESAPASESTPPAATGESACGTPHGPFDAPAATAENINVSFNEGLTSWNTGSAHSNSVYNSYPAYLTRLQNYYDKDLNLINNDNFYTCNLDSTDPLTITYSIKAAAKWSDGTPVSAADFLLAWASGSARFNNGAVGEVGDDGKLATNDNVAFDTKNDAMEFVTEFPTISDDGRSITIKYDKPYVDYNVALGPDLPSHVVGMKALGIDNAEEATAALVKDLQEYYKAAKPSEDKDGVYQADTSAVDPDLVKRVKAIADFWNTGFDFTELPEDKSLYLSTGPYVLSGIVADQSMTFTRNEAYDPSTGPQPAFDQITYRIIGEPMAAAQALENGEVDIIAPQATTDVLEYTQGLKDQGVETLTGDGATYEHVDLAQNNKGPFDPATYGGDAEKALKVRSAFLKTIPKSDIVTKLIHPLNPNATVRQSFNVVPGSPRYDTVVAGNGSADWADVDIEGAKALLAEAGVTTPVKVRFMYADNNPRRAAEYQIISQSAKLAGFDVIDGKNAEWSSKLPDTSIYDAALFGWQSTSTGAGQIPPNYQKGGQNNYYGYSNDESNTALDQLKFEPDADKQTELITTVEKNLFADAFGAVLFQFPSIVAFNSNNVVNVQDLSLAPNYFWNYWEWAPPA